jgi:enamine deaminase RidA (YjgF/YER057c/UK114 family)
MTHTVLQPAGWPRPQGYANGIAARGLQVFIAGQIGWDESHQFTDPSLSGQVRRALENILRVLAEAGGRPEHVVRLTWYVTSRDEYLKELPQIGAAYRELMGKNFPVMAVVQVVALVASAAKVEIEATAVLPEA